MPRRAKPLPSDALLSRDETRARLNHASEDTFTAILAQHRWFDELGADVGGRCWLASDVATLAGRLARERRGKSRRGEAARAAHRARARARQGAAS